MTLLEVMLAVGILALITGTLYQSIYSTLYSATEIRRIQATSDQISGLMDSCREALATMPPPARIRAVRSTGTNGQPTFEIRIRNSPPAFTFGGTGMVYADKVLITEEGTNNTYNINLAIIAPTASTSSTATDTTTTNLVPPINLVSGVKSIHWEFWNWMNGTFQDDWDIPGRRPSIIRLSIQTSEDTTTNQAVFWVAEPRS